MRPVRIGAVLLAGAVVGSFVALAPASSQDTDPSAPAAPPSTPALAPAPTGFAEELVDLYRTIHGSAQDAIALGAPAELAADASTPEEFEALVAALDGDALASLYRAGEGRGWTRVETAADDLAAATTAIAPSRPSVTSESAPVERTSASVLPAPAPSAATMTGTGPFAVERDVPAIPPPPPPFAPSTPVAAAETLVCPDVPAGADVGNLPIYIAKVITSAISAVVEIIPEEIEYNNGFIALTYSNPARIAGEVIKEIATVTELTLTWNRDRYWDCGGVNVFRFAVSTENTAVQLYGLVDQANRTLNTINDGMITVSDQLQFLQESEDHIRTLRIQQALAAPIGSVANVAYVLPASEGGYLDAEPVGVRAIVHRTLEAAHAAGLPVNFAANVWRVHADAALVTGNEALAYEMYQRTYQAIGR